MANLCVFCGSQSGNRASYVEAAREMGRLLGVNGHGLVYGGGRVGLMGEVADSALAAGASVLGVIPHDMAGREVAHDGLTELVLVDDMHQRKALMYARADAFVALPGGIGTFEEFFETYTWLTLGYHEKPVVLCNIEGFFDPLVATLDRAAEDGFLYQGRRDVIAVCESPAEVLATVFDTT